MKVRLNGTPIRGVVAPEVSKELVNAVRADLFDPEKYYKVTSGRVRLFARELAKRIDGALADYFETLAHLIMVQGSGGQSISGNKKYFILKYRPLSDSHFRAKQLMAKGGKRGISKNSTGFLAANPRLAGRNSFYAFSGDTYKRLQGVRAQQTLGKTKYRFNKAAFKNAKLADRQDGRRDFMGRDVQNIAMGNLSFELAPNLPESIYSTIYGRGPDQLGFHLARGWSAREQTILAGGRSGHIRRLASPVFAYYLRVKIPAAINSYISRRAQTVFYSEQR